VEEASAAKAPSGVPKIADAEKIETVAGKPVSAAPPVREAGVYREDWLLKQNPENFTLQLIGVGDAEGVQRFLRAQQLSGDLAYFQTLRNGKPWFIVVKGVYPSRAAAVAARDSLPARLRQSGVWPRTLGSVHEAIRVR
jgi:DamX protein